MVKKWSETVINVWEEEVQSCDAGKEGADQEHKGPEDQELNIIQWQAGQWVVS